MSEEAATKSRKRCGSITFRGKSRANYETSVSSATVTMLNIAQGATVPERVFFCEKELLHSVELDILFLEYTINESGGTFSELLLRQASTQSAVMFVETFSSRDEREGFKSAQKEHDVFAKYYDVPIISARDAFRDAFRRDVDVLNRYF